MKIESLENRQLLAGTDCPTVDELCPAYCAEIADHSTPAAAFASAAWDYTGGAVVRNAISPVVGPVYSKFAAPVVNPVLDNVVSPTAGLVVDKVLAPSRDAVLTAVGLSGAQFLAAAANFALSAVAMNKVNQYMPGDTWTHTGVNMIVKGGALLGSAIGVTGTSALFGMAPEDAATASFVGGAGAVGMKAIFAVPGVSGAAEVVTTKAGAYTPQKVLTLWNMIPSVFGTKAAASAASALSGNDSE